MSATLPILASVVLVLAGGFANEGRWPRYGTRSLASFGVILVVFAFLSSTRAKPVVGAFAWLILMGVAFVTIPALGGGERNDPISGDTRTPGTQSVRRVSARIR